MADGMAGSMRACWDGRRLAPRADGIAPQCCDGGMVRPRQPWWIPLLWLSALALAVAALVAWGLPNAVTSRASQWWTWIERVGWIIGAVSGVAALATPVAERLQQRRRERAERETAEAIARREQEEVAVAEIGRRRGWWDQLRRVRECDPLTLGVHEALPLPASLPPSLSAQLDPRLPVYVERDLDSDLRSWLYKAQLTGGFALVTGGSSVGKTRSVYEAISAVMPDWHLLRIGRAATVNRLGDPALEMPTPGLVLWLDELQNFVQGPYLNPRDDALDPEILRRLLNLDTPIILISTTWHERFQELRSKEKEESSHVLRPRYPEAHEVLGLATFHRSLPDRPFTTDSERRSLANAAERDPRIVRASKDPNYGTTQVLAGGDWLIRRFDNAPRPYSHALLSAAIDARWLGVRGPLSESLLRDLARAYLPAPERADEWFAPALAYATARDPYEADTAALLPIADPDNRKTVGFEIADYLLQHMLRQRRLHPSPIPALAWHVLAEHIDSGNELHWVGNAAFHRDLPEIAEVLYRRAASLGDGTPSASLVRLLKDLGRDAEIEELWREGARAGDASSLRRLGILLAAEGRDVEAEQVCREGLAGGDARICGVLANLLSRQGRRVETEDVWRQGVALGDVRSCRALADALRRPAWHPESDQLMRDIAENSPAVYQTLTALLRRASRHGEAEELLREVAGGEPGIRRILGDLLQQQERYAEAERLLRGCLTAGDVRTHRALATILRSEGRHAEADEVLRSAVAAGDYRACRMLVYSLEMQGRGDEVEGLWRECAAAGDPGARKTLASLLKKQGRDDEIEEVWRQGANAGDANARRHLAGLLYRQGRHAEAEQVWREAARCGDKGALHTLTELLEKQARHAEAESLLWDALNAGIVGAVQHLIALLRHQGRDAEIEHVRRVAVDADLPGSVGPLANLLYRKKRYVEAEQVWRDAIANGVPGARRGLAHLLRKLDREAEIELVWRDGVAAGDPQARRQLAELLERRRQLEVVQGASEA